MSQQNLSDSEGAENKNQQENCIEPEADAGPSSATSDESSTSPPKNKRKRERKPRERKTASSKSRTRSRSTRKRQNSKTSLTSNTDSASTSATSEPSTSVENPNDLNTDENLVASNTGTCTEQGANARERFNNAEGQSSNSTPGSSSGEGRNAKERFNNRDQAVTPLKKCSELVSNLKYKILNIVRINTKFGVGIRAEVVDSGSPTGSSFVFLPSRHRNMTDNDLQELNLQAQSSEGLYLVYKGRVGRADMVELL